MSDSPDEQIDTSRAQKHLFFGMTFIVCLTFARLLEWLLRPSMAEWSLVAGLVAGAIVAIPLVGWIATADRR